MLGVFVPSFTSGAVVTAVSGAVFLTTDFTFLAGRMTFGGPVVATFGVLTDVSAFANLATFGVSFPVTDCREVDGSLPSASAAAAWDLARASNLSITLRDELSTDSTSLSVKEKTK